MFINSNLEDLIVYFNTEALPVLNLIDFLTLKLFF